MKHVLAVLILQLFSIHSHAITIDPLVRFSTWDTNGDGIFESFDTSHNGSLVNPGLPQNGRISHAEFDLSSYADQALSSMLLHFSFRTNNFFHQTQGAAGHERTFDVNIYFGNGAADLGDADQTNHANVSTVTYLSAVEEGLSFSIDLTNDFLSMFGGIGGSTYLGVSLVGLETQGGAWGPSHWQGDGLNRAPQLIVETQVPAPTPFYLILGSLIFLVRKWSKGSV